jgi:Tfp pilus assembly protein PilV
MKFLILQKNKNLKNNGGFTIIESLVAIFIILLAITGPMVFTQNGLRTAFLSRDQITAFFLSQDAIETIKNYRNGEAIGIINNTNPDPLSWMGTFFNNCFDNPTTGDIKGCSIITRSGVGTSPGVNAVVQKCDSYNSAFGCLDDSNPERYKPLEYWDGQISGCPTGGIGVIFSNSKDDCTRSTIFAREISMKYVGQTGTERTDEVEITVKVRWKSHEGIGIREIVVKENIFNLAKALK